MNRKNLSPWLWCRLAGFFAAGGLLLQTSSCQGSVNEILANITAGWTSAVANDYISKEVASWFNVPTSSGLGGVFGT
jgi:hypothetical protein